MIILTGTRTGLIKFFNILIESNIKHLGPDNHVHLEDPGHGDNYSLLTRESIPLEMGVVGEPNQMFLTYVDPDIYKEMKQEKVYFGYHEKQGTSLYSTREGLLRFCHEMLRILSSCSDSIKFSIRIEDRDIEGKPLFTGMSDKLTIEGIVLDPDSS